MYGAIMSLRLSGSGISYLVLCDPSLLNGRASLEKVDEDGSVGGGGPKPLLPLSEGLCVCMYGFRGLEYTGANVCSY